MLSAVGGARRVAKFGTQTWKKSSQYTNTKKQDKLPDDYHCGDDILRRRGNSAAVFDHW